MKRKVCVCNEDTNVSQLVLNNKIYKTMSLDNFTNNQKIIKYPNNRMAIANKDINADNKQPLLTTIFMPFTMLLKASLDKHVVLPSNNSNTNLLWWTKLVFLNITALTVWIDLITTLFF